MCAGDFNKILENLEKWGESERRSNQINDFRSALEETGLCDLGFIGTQYTWSKGNSSCTRICERLDRAVATVNWCAIFPKAAIYHLSAPHLDHIPILISTDGEELERNHKRRIVRGKNLKHFRWQLRSVRRSYKQFGIVN